MWADNQLALTESKVMSIYASKDRGVLGRKGGRLRKKKSLFGKI